MCMREREWERERDGERERERAGTIVCWSLLFYALRVTLCSSLSLYKRTSYTCLIYSLQEVSIHLTSNYGFWPPNRLNFFSWLRVCLLYIPYFQTTCPMCTWARARVFLWKKFPKKLKNTFLGHAVGGGLNRWYVTLRVLGLSPNPPVKGFLRLMKSLTQNWYIWFGKEEKSLGFLHRNQRSDTWFPNQISQNWVRLSANLLKLLTGELGD